MKLNKAREIIHGMRSSLNVVTNFVAHLKLSGKDNKEFQNTTLKSIDKLKDSIEELSALVHAEIDMRKKSNHRVLK